MNGENKRIMIKRQVYMATYRHGEHWLVDVYKDVEAEEYYVYQSRVCDQNEGDLETNDSLHYGDPYDHMPTWQESKWFYDHYGD